MVQQTDLKAFSHNSVWLTNLLTPILYTLANFILFSVLGNVCNTVVVEEVVYDNSEDFKSLHATVDGCDDFRQNFYLTPNGGINENGYFKWDLGCMKRVDGVKLRNTHNAQYNDRLVTTVFQCFKPKTSVLYLILCALKL